MSEAIKFGEFLSWLETNLAKPTTIKTLGGRSEFTAVFKQNDCSMVITTSSKNRCMPLKRKSLERIFQRYVEAPYDKRHMTSYYGVPMWKKSPDMIGTPYVASIIREFVRSSEHAGVKRFK